MKAQQLQQAAKISTNPLRSVEMARLEPAPGQLLLRVRMCGVCRTDLHTIEGDLELPRLPLVPGHQVVATVEAIGAGVSFHQPGDRVGVAWLFRTCGVCEACRQGAENLCAQAQFTGLHADGGYAEYMVVDEGFAFALPAGFRDDEVAPLLCAGIIGFRSLRLSGIQPGGRLGLYGFGASAHLAIQVAHHWGCRVSVFTRGENHRQLARKLGAAWVGGAEDCIDGQLDAGVIFAPAGSLVPLALGHLRPGGTVAINAIHMSPIPQFDYQVIYGERVLRSVANFTRRDALDFLELAAAIPIRSQTTLYPLAQANLALQHMKASEIDGAAVLNVWEEGA